MWYPISVQSSNVARTLAPPFSSGGLPSQPCLKTPTGNPRDSWWNPIENPVKSRVFTDPTKHQLINAAKAATIRRHLVDLLLEDQRMPKALFLTSGTGVWACFCKDKIEMRHACLYDFGHNSWKHSWNFKLCMWLVVYFLLISIANMGWSSELNGGWNGSIIENDGENFRCRVWLLEDNVMYWDSRTSLLNLDGPDSECATSFSLGASQWVNRIARVDYGYARHCCLLTITIQCIYHTSRITVPIWYLRIHIVILCFMFYFLQCVWFYVIFMDIICAFVIVLRLKLFESTLLFRILVISTNMVITCY